MPLSPSTSLGRYEVLSQLGAGGMGDVYLAHDTQLKRKVALKVLPAELISNRERLHRFKREARAASALNHPNIITIHEIGAEGGTHFIAMELVEGETLRSKLHRARLEIEETLNVAAQVAAALDAAHRSRIVHRDIKPENIMLRADGLVKVLDFGLAKLTENKDDATAAMQAPTRTQRWTNPGVVIGTVAYMSPEQARGLQTDELTDIWSLGIVIYEMLAGHSPFIGETLTDALANILHHEPSSILVHRQDTPAELARILAKTLRKNKDERYQTARDLAVDLKNLQKRLEFEAELERCPTPEAATARREAAQSQDKQVSTLILDSAATRTTPPNNLPANRSHLIGREKEIAEIQDLLRREEVRLLTMTGVGGTGKTTLAVGVAGELLTQFKDGVFFVEFASIKNSALVASTIVQPLGVKEAGGKPVLEILKEYLRSREILLVVDNFEQVTSAASVLAELIVAAPQLKILVTTRTLLHLSMEREYPVPPLALPSENCSASELTEYAAVALFVERARVSRASFALTDDNAQSVAKICAQLDGLPLAIELAAARVKILSPPAILARLDNRLQLLTGGARDMPERQQTMRSAIAWSYDLLTEDEKVLFRRLAVFVGRFTLDAAEAVCEMSEPRAVVSWDSSDINLASTAGSDLSIRVLDRITSLVEQSLIVSKEQADATSFRILEVVREYALDALVRSNEADAVRRAHAAYFLALGEEAEPHLQASRSAEWLNRLEEEHENLRAALRWLLEYDEEAAVRLAAAIRILWIYHSHLTEGRVWLKAALERSPDASSALRFKLLYALGQLARDQGDYETARKAYEEILDASRAAGDKRHIALSSRALGGVAKGQGDFTAARKFIEEALTISRELNGKFVIGTVLTSLGDLARIEGNNAAARPLFEESLAIVREIGNKHGVSAVLNNLAAVAYGEGDYEGALSHYTEALAVARELGRTILISYSLDGFAALAVTHRDAKHAALLAGAAQKLRESIGYEIEPADRRFRDTYLTLLCTTLDEAAFRSIYEQGRKLKVDEAIALALETV